MTVILNSHLRNDLLACEQRFKKNYIKGKTEGSTNPHIAFGSAFALGAHNIRIRGQYDNTFNETHLTARHKGIMELMNCLDEYQERYSHTSSHELVHSETKLTMNLGTDYIYEGTPDAIYREVSTGKILLIDDKTCTNFDYVKNNFTFSGQLIGYCALLIHNGFGFPKQILIRAVNPASKSLNYIEEIEIEITEKQVHQFTKQLIFDFEKAHATLTHNFNHYAFNEACHSYGSCAYLSTCQEELSNGNE